MTQKGTKYTLLDKNQQDESDMIEMVDITTFKNGGGAGKDLNQDVDYVKLDDEDHKPQQNKTHQQNVQQSQKKAQPPQGESRKVAPSTSTQGPVYPTHSANPNPTRINMNGTNYKLQNAPQPKRASKFPQMKVACNFCTFEQMVPGNTQVYVCCCCNNMNECFPLYGLFVCGHCQCKVCYPYGTSDMIRCTRCGTVNRVPTQPQRTYMKDLPKNQPKKEQPKQEQKQQKKEQFKFENEDDLVIDQEEEPQKPVKKVREEQLLFDDVPLQKPAKEEGNYPDIL